MISSITTGTVSSKVNTSKHKTARAARSAVLAVVLFLRSHKNRTGASCHHFVGLNKMLRRPFCARPQNAHHVRGNTKMMLTIFASPRKWSARSALPPSCPSARYPLPLPTQTQNGSQGRFCAKEGHIKNDHLPVANSRRGYYGCVCPPYIQIKKEEKFSPMGVVRRVCAFLYCLLSASSVSSASYHIWYGGQQADNRPGALRICCPPVVRQGHLLSA